MDEHQDHFVMDTTIIKVRSVNEAADRTVSLPVPTAMTASDMVTGAYCVYRKPHMGMSESKEKIISA
jgi:hypothetical protein